MTNTKFIKAFFCTIGILITCHLLIICYVNPNRTAPLSLSDKYRPQHANVILRKAELMEAPNTFETLIIGSSTSEGFSVPLVNQTFKTKSFHADIGGANTATRLVLFKSALKNFSNLKRVIYVADLYEFNQISVVPDVAFNDKLSSELKDSDVLPNKAKYVEYLFTHQLIESTLDVIKKHNRGYISPFQADGTTSQSMVLSTVETEKNYYALVQPENKKKLNEEILENYTTYSQSVLANFSKLDPHVSKMVIDMVSMAQKNNIEVIFFMSPYHSEFKKRLFKIPNVETRYNEWIKFFSDLKEEKNVLVFDSTTSFIANEPESGVWRDGIHFNSSAAAYFLTELKKDHKND